VGEARKEELRAAQRTLRDIRDEARAEEVARAAELLCHNKEAVTEDDVWNALDAMELFKDAPEVVAPCIELVLGNVDKMKIESLVKAKQKESWKACMRHSRRSWTA